MRVDKFVGNGRKGFRMLALLFALAPGLVAGPTRGSAQEIARCDDLPAAVEAKRDAIGDAAAAGDLEALAALTDPAGFTYSFGNGEGALAYWQRLRAERGKP